MATHDYDNPATQDERKAVLRNDSYFARQQNTVDDSGGRFAKLTPATITGSRSLPQYPQAASQLILVNGSRTSNRAAWLLGRCNGAGGTMPRNSSELEPGAEFSLVNALAATV